MKDEIKEILDYLKDENEYYDETEQVTVDYGEIILEKEDIDKLLDCITNLQEENERLNNIIYKLKKYINEEVEDYNKVLNSKLLSESGKEKYEAEKVCFLDMLDKLNELKGDNK